MLADSQHSRYKRPDTPRHEARRLEALRACAVLDSDTDAAYDNIVRMAALACGTPIALISFVDSDRQWFKASIGLDVKETPRSQSFCAHAILEPSEILTVCDTMEDDRFADNPLVTDAPYIRFYAGVPLVSPGGDGLGTLCVIDQVPHPDGVAQPELLSMLSRQVSMLLAQGQRLHDLEQRLDQQQNGYERLQNAYAELQRTNLALEMESTTDALTGIANRRSFDTTLAAECERALRNNQPLSVLMIDVDHFKNFNDTYGHLAGDQILSTLAVMLQFTSRAFEHVARYGGEEFAMILPNTTAAVARRVAERVRLAICRHHWPFRPVTISIGVATTDAEHGHKTLLGRADVALYTAKQSGRNRVECAR